jgi:hypothetical protein
MDTRLGVVRRQEFVWTAVAIDTSGRVRVSAFDGLGVEAALVSSLLVCVATDTRDPLRRRLMRGTLYVRVAIHAGEHAAGDGIFKRLRIDVPANGLAIDLVRQSSVAVAGETLVSRGLGGIFLGRSRERARCQKKGEGNSRRKRIPYCSRGHALTRHFLRIKRFLVSGIPAAFPCQIYLARPRM